MPSGFITSDMLYRRILDRLDYEAAFGLQSLEAYSNSLQSPAMLKSHYTVVNTPEHVNSFLGRLRYRIVTSFLPKVGLSTNNSLQRAYAAYHGALNQAAQLSVSRDQLADLLRKVAEDRDRLADENKQLQLKLEAENVQIARASSQEFEQLKERVNALAALITEREKRFDEIKEALAERELSLRRAQQAAAQRDQLILEYQRLSIEREQTVNELFKTLNITCMRETDS